MSRLSQSDPPIRNAASHGYGPNNLSPRAFWLDFKAGVAVIARLLRHLTRRGEADDSSGQAPLPASVSAEDQPTTGSVG